MSVVARSIDFPWLSETYGARICYVDDPATASGGGAGGGASGVADPGANGGGDGGVSGGTGDGAAGTIGDGDDGGRAAAVPATWPTDWREKFAGDDAASLTQLKRFQSPENFFKSHRALESRVNTDFIPKPPAADAKPEEIAGYRQKAGLPAEPAGYLEALPDGLIVSEDDKAMVNDFLTTAHGVHAPKEMVGKFIDWYYKTEEKLVAEQATKDAATKATNEDALRAEWGNEFRSNLSAIKNFLPPELYGNLMGARLADGTKFGDNALALRWLVATALDVNPMARTVAGGDGADGAQAVDTRITEIEKTMKTDRKAYNADDKMQAEYRTLIERRAVLAQRRAA